MRFFDWLYCVHKDESVVCRVSSCLCGVWLGKVEMIWKQGGGVDLGVVVRGVSHRCVS